jgi:hypothetical protein
MAHNLAAIYPPVCHCVTQTLEGGVLELFLRGLILKKIGGSYWCLRRKEATTNNQLTMAELTKEHYFTAATLSRTHRWMAADCVFNF